jgi:hypothetical protein
MEARTMKLKLTFVALAILVLSIFIPSAAAQRPASPLKISVALEQKGIEGAMLNALLPMIASNPNLQLVTDASWDIDVLITCEPTNQDGSGVACSDTILYAPFGIEVLIDAAVIVSQTPQTAAQYAYTLLLQDSTPDKIAAADQKLSAIVKNFTAIVLQYQQAHPSDFKIPAKKEPAKPNAPPAETKDRKIL